MRAWGYLTASRRAGRGARCSLAGALGSERASRIPRRWYTERTTSTSDVQDLYLTAVWIATTPPVRFFQVIAVNPAARSSAASAAWFGKRLMESLR